MLILSFPLFEFIQGKLSHPDSWSTAVWDLYLRFPTNLDWQGLIKKAKVVHTNPARQVKLDFSKYALPAWKSEKEGFWSQNPVDLRRPGKTKDQPALGIYIHHITVSTIYSKYIYILCLKNGSLALPCLMTILGKKKAIFRLQKCPEISRSSSGETEHRTALPKSFATTTTQASATEAASIGILRQLRHYLTNSTAQGGGASKIGNL